MEFIHTGVKSKQTELPFLFESEFAIQPNRDCQFAELLVGNANFISAHRDLER